MKHNQLLVASALTLLATACGSSDSNDSGSDTGGKDNTPVVSSFGPYSTGTSADSKFVYFDLDTQTELTLTAEEAAANSEWDIAFKRTGVYLNTHADNTVGMYFTGNNADFFDADGKAIVDSFVNATAETELEDYTSVTADAVPADDMFKQDETKYILDGFYDYDPVNHVASASADKYFIVQSDGIFSKFRVSDFVKTAARGLSSVTFTLANQGASDDSFEAESTLTVDAVAACASYLGLYVDFDLKQMVSSTDAWDFYMPCTGNNDQVGYEMHIADDATAIQDFGSNYSAIDTAALRYYYFQPDEYHVKAFDDQVWYQYNLQSGHKLWSQYGVYLIKTASATYKLQITGYYNADLESGNYSFRADAL
ncbi:HmuY family protein (plasmid) [Catenovulum sp. SX2]|uniref:HmuY family protein n=1 Tax=Catenovulum sp. SX2 TaxID=3398614 RepID=UPI003F874E9C